MRNEILISFYSSALAVLLITLWGYFTECLPPDLLQPADYHFLAMIKSFLGRPRRVSLADDQHPFQSQKQQRRSRAIVAFLKILSDQQLITGIAILVGALSNGCQTSLYELHVVTSLAYFTATSHVLSLDVLRGYFWRHTLVRHCRVVFTLVFLTLFIFVYTVDYSVVRFNGRISIDPQYPVYAPRTLNSGMAVQCIFLGYKPYGLSARNFGSMTGGDIAIIIAKHISPISRLYTASRTSDAAKPRSTGNAMDRIWVHWIHYRHGLPLSECSDVVYDARKRCDSVDRSRKSSGRRSLTYYLQSYYGAYLSQVPLWALQFAYGTQNTIRAVWYSDVQVSDELKTLGFGQVVTIGLLLLPLLAFLQIINGKSPH